MDILKKTKDIQDLFAEAISEENVELELIFGHNEVKNPINKTIFLKLLDTLKKDYNFAVFTSKDKSRTKIILKNYKFFKYIVTSDDVIKGKPYPEGLIKILKKIKNKKKDTIYIGDSIYDYKAAKNIGIKYLHAKWGYEKQLKKKLSINEISSFLEIEKYL